MRDGGRIINSYDVHQALDSRLPSIEIREAGAFEPRFVLRTPDLVSRGKVRNFKTWDAAVAYASAGDEWVTPKQPRYAQGVYFPIAVVAISAEMGLNYETDRSRATKPLPWSEPGRPCERYNSGSASYTNGSFCGRLSTGGEAPGYFRDGMFPACAVHAGAEKRRQANAAVRAEQNAEQEAKRQRQRETERAIEEALERLRPKLASLGIHPDTVTAGRKGIEIPAESLETIVRAAIELDEIMQS